MLKHLTLLIFLFTQLSFDGKTQVQITAVPNWVEEISWEEKNLDISNGGYQNLLIDVQDNLIDYEEFYHYAIKVLNTEGAQNVSDIEVVYYPDYQHVKFHKLKIFRDGNEIDKLHEVEIKNIQRERNLERKIYDGSQSAIINLSDVRIGDVIEYSYTVIGTNPILDGHYHYSYTQQYSSFVNRIYDRTLVRPSTDLQYQLLEGASEPKVSVKSGYKEYVWDNDSIKPVIYENNVPRWYNAQQRTILSSFQNWEDVVNWALPLYKFTETSFPEIEEMLEDLVSTEEKAVRIIRFVQDEVRYLAFENGIASYLPHEPKLVYKNRYGDCKDKSLLLVAMLRSIDVEAYPMLVHSSVGKKINDELPGQNSFNHCVVQLTVNEKEFFIDPTISLQGGGLEETYFPDYSYGLIIKEGEKQLQKLPNESKSSIDVKETFNVDSVGGTVKLTVLTTYLGERADFIRSYFSNNSADKIGQDYINFYSALYPEIESTHPVEIYDRSRESENMVQVEENYIIKNFWEVDEKQSKMVSIVEALVLEDYINYPGTAERKMPYYLNGPMQYSQSSIIVFPEDQGYSSYIDSIKGDDYLYSISIQSFSKSICVDYYYEISKDFLMPEEVSEFLKDHEAMMDNIAYHDEQRIGGSDININWISLIIALLTLIPSIYAAILIYRNFNPNSHISPAGLNIGGWLVLPAIGLILSPFTVLYTVVDSGLFDPFLWTNIAESGVDSPLNLYILVGWEMVINTMFIVFTVLLLFLFFERRSNVPVLMMILYSLNILLPIIDLLLANHIFPSQLEVGNSDQDVRDVITSIVSGLIWIPYFKFSKRVKNTFCRIYSPKK